MSIGKVKWFNNVKGYGFIIPEENDDNIHDLFAHYSSIEMDGYKTLKAGQLVHYDLLQGPKGLYAANIKVFSKEEAENHPLQVTIEKHYHHNITDKKETELISE